MGLNLTKYVSHKIVSAGKIIIVVEPTDATGDVGLLVVMDADGNFQDVRPPLKFYSRGAPVVGDYYVVYGDNYESWSPKAAFENGYTQASAIVYQTSINPSRKERTNGSRTRKILSRHSS